MWEIGQNRRVTIRKWKGKTFIDIRQMYIDSNGDLKHGKQGMKLVFTIFNQFCHFTGLLHKSGFKIHDFSRFSFEKIPV